MTGSAWIGPSPPLTPPLPPPMRLWNEAVGRPSSLYMDQPTGGGCRVVSGPSPEPPPPQAEPVRGMDPMRLRVRWTDQPSSLYLPSSS